MTTQIDWAAVQQEVYTVLYDREEYSLRVSCYPVPDVADDGLTRGLDDQLARQLYARFKAHLTLPTPMVVIVADRVYMATLAPIVARYASAGRSQLLLDLWIRVVEAVEKQAPVPVLTSFLTIPLAGGDPPNITGIGFLLDPENGGGAYTAPVSMRGEVPFYGDLRNSAHLHITNDAIDH